VHLSASGTKQTSNCRPAMSAAVMSAFLLLTQSGHFCFGALSYFPRARKKIAIIGSHFRKQPLLGLAELARTNHR
jgi:hypothetical protein